MNNRQNNSQSIQDRFFDLFSYREQRFGLDLLEGIENFVRENPNVNIREFNKDGKNVICWILDHYKSNGTNIFSRYTYIVALNYLNENFFNNDFRIGSCGINLDLDFLIQLNRHGLSFNIEEYRPILNRNERERIESLENSTRRRRELLEGTQTVNNSINFLERHIRDRRELLERSQNEREREPEEHS
jgi:hypothetical protein